MRGDRVFLVKVSAISAMVLSLALAACGGSGGGGEGGGTGDATKGATLVMQNACGSCHDGSKGTLAGGDTAQSGVYPPNLTSDKDTGLGGWSDAQVKKAISSGVDDEGKTLCASMPTFALSEQDLNDMVAYLRSLSAVSNKVPDGTCSL